MSTSLRRVEPSGTPSRFTRRQLLAAGGTAAGAMALGGGVGLLTQLGSPSPNLASTSPPALTFRTRPDLKLPTLAVSTTSDRVAPGLLFIAPYNAPDGGQAGASIIDDTGAPVWQQPLANRVTTDFRVQRHAGRDALTWWDGTIALGHGVGAYVIADEHYTPIAHVQAGNGQRGDLHEFLLTSRATALLTTYRVTTADLRSVGGSVHGSIQDAMFQEIELSTGRVLIEWHSLDHVPIEESYWPVGGDWDYFHINSIDVDDDDHLLVSSRNMHTVYKVHRVTGEIIWRLGGKRSDFAVAAGARFAWQHDVRRQPDGTITMFDNAGSPGGESQSRGLALAVDERRRTATVRRSYYHPSSLLASSQGNTQVLPNGNVFISWGSEPYVSEFSADGELLFDAKLGGNSISYRAFRTPWTGIAPGVPAIAAARAGHSVRLWVSWNGDTRVRHWLVMGGDRVGSLRPLGSVGRTGLETALTVRGTPKHVAVRGLDAAGHAAGQSATITV